MPAHNAPGKIFAALVAAVLLDWVCARVCRAATFASKLSGTRAAAPPRLGINAHRALILYHALLEVTSLLANSEQIGAKQSEIELRTGVENMACFQISIRL